LVSASLTYDPCTRTKRDDPRGKTACRLSEPTIREIREFEVDEGEGVYTKPLVVAEMMGVDPNFETVLVND
jgi:hypothetical protein